MYLVHQHTEAVAVYTEHVSKWRTNAHFPVHSPVKGLFSKDSTPFVVPEV